MDLFTPDGEIIGTNGVRPGLDEWYTPRDAARALIKGDWETWGDLRLDVESASIHAAGEVGWIAASATVTQTIGADNYASFLDFIQKFIDNSTLPAEQKLHYILRGGTNTVYELRRGENSSGRCVLRRWRAPGRRLEVRPGQLLVPDHPFSGCAHPRW